MGEMWTAPNSRPISPLGFLQGKTVPTSATSGVECLIIPKVELFLRSRSKVVSTSVPVQSLKMELADGGSDNLGMKSNCMYQFTLQKNFFSLKTRFYRAVKMRL